MITTEKRFEADIESFFLSPAGGYTKGADTYDAKQGLYVNTLIDFVQRTQPKEWARFENANQVDPVRKFCTAFNTACETEGLLSVLRHGFKHRGLRFLVCYFKPESALNQAAAAQWAANTIECYRQWYFSADTKKSVDMVLVLNGIPVFAFELKNQYTGQTVDDAKRQWMYDRDPRELCFQFNKRILAYFCVDHTEVWMTTKLAGKNTYFLPFNQGSNGAGNDGGKGNPANPNGYPTAYLWEDVFQKDSMMDIVQKFMNLKDGKTLIFPRYHQLDAVRKLLADVRQNGAGHNYLIQHSAGSGKSNSIAWTAYRLASLFNEENKPVFSSVVVVTDRTVLDAQLQETISGFDHTLGAIETIGEDKTSKDLRDAINGGVRIIVTTLQKFPVIYQEVDKVAGRNFAIIVDEAHSSQTGSSALKLKAALADTEDALREYLKGLLRGEGFDHSGLIYGMGHAVYSVSDPRAVILKSFVEQLSDEKGCHAEYQLYATVERLAKEVITQNRKIYKGVCANVDFYSGFVYRMLGLPMDLFTPIFAIARIAGWSAHRLEELINCRKIIRPAYLSVAEPQEYVPLEER